LRLPSQQTPFAEAMPSVNGNQLASCNCNRYTRGMVCCSLLRWPALQSPRPLTLHWTLIPDPSVNLLLGKSSLGACAVCASDDIVPLSLGRDLGPIHGPQARRDEIEGYPDLVPIPVSPQEPAWSTAGINQTRMPPNSKWETIYSATYIFRRKRHFVLFRSNVFPRFCRSTSLEFKCWM
jgi:hypothetical protein